MSLTADAWAVSPKGRCPIRKSLKGHNDPTMMRSLWATVQKDPTFMRRVNGWLTVFWIAMIPVSVVFGWIYSVAYISALSLWALVSGHWSAWQAARVEVKQQEEAERRSEEDVAGEVVERMVQETDLAPGAGTTAAETGS